VDDPGRPAVVEAPRPIAPGIDRRRSYLPLALLLAAIAILLVKPWGGGTDRDAAPSGSPGAAVATPLGPAAGGAAGAPTTPVATPVDPLAGLVVTCGSPSGWRAATLQAWAGRPAQIRSWIAIEPVEASGPLDPRIPFAPVATDRVTAIGYCAPLDELQRPPATAGAELWALRDGGALRLSLVLVEPASPNALGGLWLPGPEVPRGSGPAGAWPPGRYAIRVASPGGDYARWMGVEILDLGRLRPPSAPSASPDGPGTSGSPGASAAPAPAPATP
jgi:hypothetical protein